MSKKFEKEFFVTNPSKYERSDYVEVDLDHLDVPDTIDESKLKLHESDYNGNIGEEIPYQIDYILGKDKKKRLMTFLSQKTPPGLDDYSQQSKKFFFIEGTPHNFTKEINNTNLRVSHYYRHPEKDEHSNGYNEEWYENREVSGVEFYNDNLKFYISLKSHPGSWTSVDYSGALTYIESKEAREKCGAGEILSPFEDYPAKRWGQITNLVFFPLPWELKWFNKFSMKGIEYKLVWSSSYKGIMRAVAVLKSDDIVVEYDGHPFIDEIIKKKCNLYRVFYIYPNMPYYIE